MPFSLPSAAAALVGVLLAIWMVANFRADRANQAIQDSDRDVIERMAAASKTGQDTAVPDTTGKDTTGKNATDAQTPPTPEGLTETRDHSLRRVRDEPLDTWPLSMLAFLADARGDEAETDRIRTVLLDRTKRDLATLVWSADRSLRTDDVGAALQGLDLLSRLNAPAEIRDKVYAALVLLASQPAAQSALVAQLKLLPGWRQTFLNALASNGAPGVFPDLMHALQDEPLPSANPAWRTYLLRLIKLGEAPQAYALWIGLQPAERLALLGNVFDGSFSAPSDGTIFDWNLAGNSGIAASFAKGEGEAGRAALRLEFSGTRVPQGLANQFIVLAPGSYRLSGRLRYEKLETERGLGWQVYCLDGDKSTLIGETGRFSGDHDWTPFLADFEVPASLCSVQLLQLTLPARIAVEQVIRGRFWTDDLAITRADRGGVSPSN